MVLLACGDVFSLGVWEFPLRVVLLAGMIWACRSVLDFHVVDWLGSICVGLAVFGLWILPDLAWPNYRHSILFENFATGKVESSFAPVFHHSGLALVFRTIRAVVIVPIVEELFWRGWLMRWLISPVFSEVPLGTFRLSAFVIVALLFASEHGPFWDVGLMAGIVYNIWMIRKRSLGDCILAHAITNGVLSAYVIAFGRWEYW